MGKYKWEKLGIPYTLADTEPATHEQIEPAIAAFRAAGLVAY
jgi:hypothetical protein